MENKDPLDAALDLVIADRDNVGAVYFMMSEDEVKLAMQQPWVSVGTDHPESQSNRPAQRRQGASARLRQLRAHPRQVRSRRARHHDGRRHPQIHFASRTTGAAGKSRHCCAPAISPTSPSSIPRPSKTSRPSTTRTAPQRGFEYVFVNGVLALEHDKVTGQMGGRPLRGPGYAMRDYVPDGLPPRGKVQGVVTDEGGYPSATLDGYPDRRLGQGARHGQYQERWPLRNRPRAALPGLFAGGRTCRLRAAEPCRHQLQRVELAVVQLCAEKKQVAIRSSLFRNKQACSARLIPQRPSASIGRELGLGISHAWFVGRHLR